MIAIYDSVETSFTSNGLGCLPDATFIEVTHEINGVFELEMDYPIDGHGYSRLDLRKIIFVKPDPYSKPQPFRIYSISVPMNGVVTVYARHIVYDLDGYTISAFLANGLSDAISLINAKKRDCPFQFYADENVNGVSGISEPSDIWSVLGNGDGSLLANYGGEFEFDMYNVRWHKRIGTDNGVSVTYGKNLTDFNQETSCSATYTAVHPYWKSEESGVVELPEKIVKATGNYDYVRAFPLDLTDTWEEQPTADMLRNAASLYMDAHGIGVPEVSIDVSFVALSQTEEYRQYSLLEKVRLGDTVNVRFPLVGVSAKSRCVKTVYNAITDRYVSVSLGETKRTIESTISGNSNDISKQPTQDEIQSAIDDATKMITGNFGGYVVLHSSTGGTSPDEILVMNDPDLKKASQVWRWNKSGLGFSPNGYNGPYITALTADGRINADLITVGKMSARVIEGGVLQSKNFDGNKGFYFNLDNGEIRASQLTILTSFMKDVIENGVSKLTTGIGLTISETAVEIYKPGDSSNLTNTLNQNGMYVIRAKGTDHETVILQADKDGVIAKDLKAKNYLIVADLMRFEKTIIHGSPMIGCFWVGG